MSYDVLIANLYAELHDLLMGEYTKYLTQGKPVILTGILATKRQLVLAALVREGFTDVQETQDGEWVLVTAHAPMG